MSKKIFEAIVTSVERDTGGEVCTETKLLFLVLVSLKIITGLHHPVTVNARFMCFLTPHIC